MTSALAMRWKLRQLQRIHDVVPEPVEVPLTAPCEHPQLVRGYAATGDIDLVRMRIMPGAFGALDPRRIKLLYRHRWEQPAGEIEELQWDEYGRLHIKAVVRHETARRAGAFSVGFRVTDFELVDEGNAGFHAVVTLGVLDEVSPVIHPSNPGCIVTHRMTLPATYEFYSLMQKRILKVMEMIQHQRGQLA